MIPKSEFETTEQYITHLELNGEIDSNCKTCQNVFYPQLRVNQEFFMIFTPRHKASNRCESGKHPHCSCDTCF